MPALICPGKKLGCRQTVIGVPVPKALPSGPQLLNDDKICGARETRCLHFVTLGKDEKDKHSQQTSPAGGKYVNHNSHFGTALVVQW